MTQYTLLFEKIAMAAIILLGLSIFVIELQLRKLRREETGVAKRIGSDETVLYKEEELLLREVSDLKQQLKALKETG